MKIKSIFIPVLCAIAIQINAQVTPGSIVVESINSFLATPANNYIKDVPVVIIRYLPTKDGVNLDVSQATDYWNLGNISINTLKTNIDNYDKRVKFSLEEGSRFHGYKDLNAKPYLGYKVIKYVTVYRQIQVSDIKIGTDGGKDLFQPDYKKEFDDLNLNNLINLNHVKEVWIWYGEAARPNWPSYDNAIHGSIQKYVTFVESNMSSPSTGDISNSYRNPNDLYILNKTYVVYCYNFRRSQAEAVHNHGHQLESIYKYTANRQDGNIGLFVQNFSGWGDNNYTIPPIGRVGDCHHPPNTKVDYDYLNSNLVQSDIEDWKPAGGITKLVNVDTWGNLVYKWPGDADFLQRKESQWYIYWMQNMPGFNTITEYNANIMTNWWHFTANWDSCYNANIGLYFSNTLPYLAISSNSEKILPTANSTKALNITSNSNWTATSNQTWLTLSSASGSKNATITLTAQANPTTATRTATITVSVTGVTAQSITITQDAGTTGIKEMSNNSVTLFPNPVTNELTIDNLNINSTISIFDLIGNLLFNKTVKSTIEKIDVSNLPNGVYSIKLIDKKIIKTSKLIKQ
jgi:hypothetical protein